MFYGDLKVYLEARIKKMHSAWHYGQKGQKLEFSDQERDDCA